MSPSSPSLDELVREYLDQSKNEEEAIVFGLLFQYLGHLYEETEEPILLEDVSSYEIDDFLQFFLPDQFEEGELASLQRQSQEVFRKFLKFLSGKKFLEREEEKEWKEVLK